MIQTYYTKIARFNLIITLAKIKKVIALIVMLSSIIYSQEIDIETINTYIDYEKIKVHHDKLVKSYMELGYEIVYFQIDNIKDKEIKVIPRKFSNEYLYRLILIGGNRIKDIDVYLNDEKSNNISKDIDSSKLCYMDFRVDTTSMYYIVVSVEEMIEGCNNQGDYYVMMIGHE